MDLNAIDLVKVEVEKVKVEQSMFHDFKTAANLRMEVVGGAHLVVKNVKQKKDKRDMQIFTERNEPHDVSMMAVDTQSEEYVAFCNASQHVKIIKMASLVDAINQPEKEELNKSVFYFNYSLN